MIRFYRNSISAANLVDSDSFVSISKEQVLFNDTFTLGSTPCLCVKVKAVKGVLGSFDTLLMTDDNSGVEVLKATLEVDEQNTDDDVYDSFTLVDFMIRFNVNYSAYSLMPDPDSEVLTYPTLLEILEDICSTCNVATDISTFNGYDKEISWYDSTISARQYLSYIAELNGGFAYITSEGKLAFKQYTANNSVVDTISVDMCDRFKLGNYFSLTRVLYDDSAGSYWEYGNTNGATVYLRTDNVYIVNADDVSSIYNIVNGFSFYSVTANKCPIGEAEIGDLIAFTLNSNTFPTITQIKQSYNNGWTGGYECMVESQEQQETTIRLNTAQQIRSIRTTIDYMNNEFSRVISDIETLDGQVSGQQTIINQTSDEVTIIAGDVSAIQANYATQTDLNTTNDNLNDLDDQINGTEGLASAVSVLASGLKVQQTTPGSYSKVVDNGLEIYVKDVKQAYATTEGFNAATFITGNWHIEASNSGNSLNFYKKGV